MVNKLFDIKFEGKDELIKLAEQQAKLLKENVIAAVTDSTMFGIGKIANDCPVDKGLLMASITGPYGDEAKVDLKRGKIGEGKALSTTKIDRLKMEGTIGTNVEYALDVEYRGGVSGSRQKLTAKQIRYLFAVGVFKRGKNGKIIYKYNRKGARGKGFFRKNIPLIQAHFNQKMNEAVTATSEGRSLGRFKGD